MSDGTDKNAATPEHDLRQIPKWARRYAQNRTLPVLVCLCIFLAFSGAIGGLSYITAWAAMSGPRALAVASGLLLCGIVASLAWFAFSGGARIMEGITRWLYRGEGNVSAAPAPEAVQRKPTLAAFLLMFCIPAEIVLGMIGLFPIRLMQPMSAIYMVRFQGLRSPSPGSRDR